MSDRLGEPPADVTAPLHELEQLLRLAASLRGIAPSAVRHRLAREASRYLATRETDGRAAAERFTSVLWESLDEAARLVAESWAGSAGSGRDSQQLFRDAATWVSAPSGKLPEVARTLAGAWRGDGRPGEHSSPER